MTNRKQIQAYVLRRLGWEYGDDFYYRSSEEDAPVNVYLDRAKAEAQRMQLQWEHVQAEKINPFSYCDATLEERTNLPLPEFLRRMRELGMEISEEGQEWELRNSLHQQYEQLAEEGKYLVWEVMDRFRFYEVIEMEVDLDE